MPQLISHKNDAPAASPVVPASTRPSEENPTLSPLAPVLMMAFWALLGGAAGIKIMQSIWSFLGFGGGEVAVAIPVGGVVGALAGALLGLIRNPRCLVLLMAVFAGSSAGAVAGKVPWGEIGEIGGQVAGGLVGGIAWATWLFIERKNESTPGARNFHLGTQRIPGGHMGDKRQISLDEARSVGARLGLDWAQIDLEQFRRGLEVELEHGARDPETNVTRDDVLLTGRIAWAHLKEIRDYYTRLDRLEAEAKEQT
jgi:hypothetical protein